MKILYDYQVFYWQEYGGISRYFCELGKRLAKKELVDMVKIAAGVYVNHYLKEFPSDLILGLYLPPISNTWRLRFFLNHTLCNIEIKQNSPDIIHETYYSVKELYKKKATQKTVITVYDMLYEKFPHLLPKSDEVCLAKKKAIERADHIICISENTKRDLLEFLQIAPEKISVVYLGSSISSCNSFNLNFQLVRYNSPYILYVGQRYSYKNFARFLRAYASTQLKHDFKIICFGGGSFSKSELELIHSINLSEEQIIQISGSDNVLTDLYAHASAFVYPSLYEGFGIPLLEAMFFGCPVVCSKTSSLPEVAGNAAKFFDPYDQDDIANALEQVLFSTKTRETLVKLGHERVKMFSWDKCADETLDIYLSLLEN